MNADSSASGAGEGEGMDAHGALNKALAEALGWHVEHSVDFEDSSVWVLYDPQGDAVTVEHYNGYDHVEVYSSPDAAWELAPDFAHSVDACLAVLPEDYAVLIRRSMTKGYYAIIHPDNEDDVWTSADECATRAEALAAATLAFAQAKQQTENGGG